MICTRCTTFVGIEGIPASHAFFRIQTTLLTRQTTRPSPESSLCSGPWNECAYKAVCAGLFPKGLACKAETIFFRRCKRECVCGSFYMQQHVCDKVSSLFPDCFLRVLACLSRLVVCTCAKNDRACPDVEGWKFINAFLVSRQNTWWASKVEVWIVAGLWRGILLKTDSSRHGFVLATSFQILSGPCWANQTQFQVLSTLRNCISWGAGKPAHTCKCRETLF